MADPLETLRRQLQQLKALHDSGTLGAEAYEPAREQLERRIVEQVVSGETPGGPKAGVRRRGVLLAGIAAALLVVAGIGTWWRGSPPAPPPAAASDAMAPAPIAAMVDSLLQRLQDNPGDTESRLMLARAYVALGRHAEALPAFKQALAQRADDAALLADYADAMAVVNQRNLAGEPLALVQRALKIDPDNLKALSLAGTAAFNQKDYAGAVKHWEHVAAVAPPGSPYAERIQGSLAEARELGGLAK